MKDLSDIDFSSMPIFDGKCGKIPYSYSNFPKNLNEEFDKSQNRFLDNYSCIIDDLKIKGFFKTNETKNHHNNCMFVSFGKVSGADLTCGNQTTNAAGGINTIYFAGLSAGIVGQYYNQVAMDITLQAGNYRMASYVDSAGSPDGLYAETASIAVPAAGFVFQSLTEFALTSTSNWVAYQNDNSTMKRWAKAGGTGTRKFIAQAYGAFPNPAIGSAVGGVEWHGKLGHT